MSWIDDAIKNYYQWLKERTSYLSDDGTGWSVISTPFIGLFNDSIDIYVKKDGDSILLSDDGETMRSLADIGISVSRSSKRRDWVDAVARTYGIQLDGEELKSSTTIQRFPQAKHKMLSAILAISDLEITSNRNIVSMFQEEVKSFLDEAGLIYTVGFNATGSSGLESTFDFQIAGKTKETVIKSFGSLGMNNLPSFLFGWSDIKETREAISQKSLLAIAIVDDREKKPKEEFVAALKKKNTFYLPWSERCSKDNLDFLHSLVN